MKAGLRIAGVGVAGPSGVGGRGFLRRVEGAGRGEACGRTADGAGSGLSAALLEGLAETHPKGMLRRLDLRGRMALAAADAALADAGVGLPGTAQWGLVLGSGHGPVASVRELYDSIPGQGELLCSPTAFSNSLPNAAAAHLAQAYGVHGPCATLGHTGTGVVAVFDLAAQWFQEHPDLVAVLAGVVDERCPLPPGDEVVGAAAVDPDVPGLPAPAEGAVFFLCVRPDTQALAALRWERRPAPDQPPGEAAGAERSPTALALDVAVAVARLGGSGPGPAEGAGAGSCRDAAARVRVRERLAAGACLTLAVEVSG